MSELAFNINGEGFEVPVQATGWRVRRMRAKGSPEVVYGRDGLPLILPIDADLDDLRVEVDVTGRYRLDLVDQHNKAITDVPSGYVQINTQQAASTGGAAPANSAPAHSDHPMVEAMRINADLAKTVVDRFPQMMEAAAVLLRAADGAGLPARRTNLLAELADVDASNDETEDGGNDTSPTIELINSLVAQVIPIVMTSLTSGKKLPKLASVLDWRKAPPPPANDEASDAADAAPEDQAPQTLDPAMMARVIAIQSALTPAEGARARQLAAELSPAEVQAWFRELAALSTEDAVAKIRSVINRTAKGGAR